MDKSQQNDQEADIAEETYKGPSSVAAGLGEGVVTHFEWAFAGLGVGAIAAAILHKPVNKVIDSGRDLAQKYVENKNFLVRLPSKFLQVIVGHGEREELEGLKKAIEGHTASAKYHEAIKKDISHKEGGMGYWLADELILRFFPKSLKEKWLSDPKVEPIINAATLGGGLLGLLGYFLVPILSFSKGTKKAHEGKRQLERAQEEIIRLRNQYAAQEPAENASSKTKSGAPTTKDGSVDLDTDGGTKEKPIEIKPAEPVATKPKSKGDSGWADAMQAQKDAKAEAEPAIA